MEQEVSQEYTEDNLETVSINQVCLHKNQLMVSTKLEMCVGNSNMVILYQIDTGKYNALVYIQKIVPKGK